MEGSSKGKNKEILSDFIKSAIRNGQGDYLSKKEKKKKLGDLRGKLEKKVRNMQVVEHAFKMEEQNFKIDKVNEFTLKAEEED